MKANCLPGFGAGAVALLAFFLSSSGCSTSDQSSTASATIAYRQDAIAFESFSRNNPNLVFVTPELREELAKQGVPPGFVLGDWEYGRKDAALGVHPPEEMSPSGPTTTVFLNFDDLLTIHGDRPRSNLRVHTRVQQYDPIID